MSEYPDLYVPYDANNTDSGFNIDSQVYETTTHPIRYVHESKLRAIEQENEGLKADVVRLEKAWDSSHNQAMENGAAYHEQKALAEQLKQQLLKLKDQHE